MSLLDKFKRKKKTTDPKQEFYMDHYEEIREFEGLIVSTRVHAKSMHGEKKIAFLESCLGSLDAYKEFCYRMPGGAEYYEFHWGDIQKPHGVYNYRNELVKEIAETKHREFELVPIILNLTSNGIYQADLVKHFPGDDVKPLINWMINNGQLEKTKDGSRVYLRSTNGKS